ncbi:Rho GTPase-activating protein domain [Trinorchestia longiramus]|nr:Rho GTPase-activating protein domain [Trinorchestia longiramus]
MEVVNDEGIKELVKDELSKLGIHDSPTLDARKQGYGAKLLSRTVGGACNKAVKTRKKELDSSKESMAGLQENFKNNPKSPFSKSRNSTKKKNQLLLKSKVFGVGLCESPQSNITLPDGNCVQVPQFLVDCCNLLRKHINLEGIFRKAGSASRQNEIKRLVDGGTDLPTNMHPIDAACLIKQFFRCLPHPLLESSIHARMLRCLMTLEEGEPRISGLALCSLLLPTPSQHSLVYFLSFLDEVVQQSSSNRMDAYNLAVVLSPNLLPMTLGSTHLAPGAAPGHNKMKQTPFAITDDNIIAANIDIIQELIRHQHRMCRLPSDVLAGLLQEQQLRASIPDQGSDATDGLQRTVAPKSRKRRSASIHRLMSGLRRVVGVQALPNPSVPNPNSPHPLHQHRITRPASPHVSSSHSNAPTSSPLLLFSPLSLHPSGGCHDALTTSPGKRKSDVLLSADEGQVDQPKKKARVAPVSKVSVEHRSSTRLSYAAAVAASSRMAPPQATASATVVKVRRSATAREPSSGSRLSFPRHPSLASFVDPSILRPKKRSPNQRRSLNLNIQDKHVGVEEKWVVKSEKLVSADSIKSKNKPTLVLYPYLDEKTISKNSLSMKVDDNSTDQVLQEESKDVQLRDANLIDRDRIPSQLYKSKSEVITRGVDMKPSAPRTPLGASKIDDCLKFVTTPNLDTMSRFSVNTPASGCRSGTARTPANSDGFTPRRSSGRISKRARRKARNARLALLSEPDGEITSTPSRPPTRGEPDGAERTLRDSPAYVEKPSTSGNNGCALTTLESQYDSIKEAVVKMEKKMNDDALDELKRSLFGDEEITSIATLNHNEIIQSAYDRMKKESNMLGMSPSENLSRRLDRELKIRRRRSGENCVVRSPSARKIGTIRRRSKELELKCQQGSSSVAGHETPACSKSAGTPRLKEPLMKSPLSHSLKRGRPNSVRCGLPFVVRPIVTETPFVCNNASIRGPNSSSSPSVETQDFDASIKSTERQGIDSCDVSSEAKFSFSSPGNMDDHALPSVEPGVALDSVFSSVDFENEQWVAASEFLQEVESQVHTNEMTGDDTTATGKQKDGNRPSIAALKKQKKVTANVQLFNQLGCVTPGQQRRQSRSCVTPGGCLALQRPAASERRQQPRGQQRSRYSARASLTPRHFNNSNALKYNQPRIVAVVSPLKENIANVTPSTSSRHDSFKTPRPPSMTPLSTRRKSNGTRSKPDPFPTQVLKCTQKS